MPTQKKSLNKSIANAAKQIRHDQLNHITEIILVLQSKLKEINNDQRKELALLESVSLGLYEEIDKLSKKAPADFVTDLVLSQTNDVIRETKQLVTDDSYIRRISEFVPAGDNPQHRDVVLVLRMIRQGLARFEEHISNKTSEIETKVKEARLIKLACEAAEDDQEVSLQYLSRFFSPVPSAWVAGDDYDKYFDFERLDKLDLDLYFSL